MKSITEKLQDSINEAVGKYKVFVIDPYAGEANICTKYPTTDPFSSNIEPLDIESTNWLHDELGNGRGNIAEISWCDDTIMGFVSDAKDESQTKKEFIQTAETWIKEHKDWFNDDNTEIYFELPCGLYYGGYWNKSEDGNKMPLGKDLYGKWIAQYNDSHVDGDSAYCKCLIDLKKKKVIAGGANVNFWF